MRFRRYSRYAIVWLGLLGGLGLWCLPSSLATVASGEEGTQAEVNDNESFHSDESVDGHSGGSEPSHSDEASDGEGGHGGVGTNPLSVDPDLMIFTAIIFLLMLAILGKFAWGPIRDGLDAREKGISDQIAGAHRNNEESRRLLVEHEQKIAKASEEVREMLEGARKEAEARKQEIMAEAEQLAKAEKDRAVREIHAAKNAALEELAKSSVDQAVGLASRIVGKQLNQGDHAKLIQDALQQFPSEN